MVVVVVVVVVVVLSLLAAWAERERCANKELFFWDLFFPPGKHWSGKKTQ